MDIRFLVVGKVKVLINYNGSVSCPCFSVSVDLFDKELLEIVQDRSNSDLDESSDNSDNNQGWGFCLDKRGRSSTASHIRLKLNVRKVAVTRVLEI